MKAILIPFMLVSSLFGKTCPWEHLSSPYSVAQREAIASYKQAVLAFKEIYRGKKIDRKEPDSVKARRTAEALSRAAEALLSRLDIPHRRIGNRIQVLPSKSTALGRYATGIMRIHGAKLVFPSPRTLLKEAYPSSYDDAAKIQELSVDALVRVDPNTGRVLSVGRLTPLDIHEASHLEEKGKFRGSIYPSGESLKELGDYGDFCSFDELRAGAIEQVSSFLPVRALKEKLQRGEAISKAERQAVLGLLAREQKEGRFWNGEIPSLVGGIRELLAEAKATLHGGKIPKAADGRREWNAGKVILVTPSDVTSIADYLNPLIEVVSRQEKAYGLLRASLNRFLFLEKDRLSNETFSDSQAKELLRAIEALEKLGSTAPSEG